MSEEDFACDKFVPQKRKADVCRNCFQPLRLHSKKQAKQGAPPAASNGAPSDGLSNSLRPFGAKGTKGVPGPSPSKPTKEAKDTMSKSVSGSPSRQQTVSSKNPDSGGISQKSPLSNEPKKDGSGSEYPNSSLKPATSSGSKTINTSKSSSLLPAKPPPPPVASSVKKRNSLPRIAVGGVSSKPLEAKSLPPKKPPPQPSTPRSQQTESSNAQKEINTSKAALTLADAGLNQQQPSMEVAKEVEKEPMPKVVEEKSAISTPVRPDELKNVLEENKEENHQVEEISHQQDSEQNLVAEKREASHVDQVAASTEEVVEVKEFNQDKPGSEGKVETTVSSTNELAGANESTGQGGCSLEQTPEAVPAKKEEMRQEENGDISHTEPLLVEDIPHSNGVVQEDNILHSDVVNKSLPTSLSGDIPSTLSSGEEPVVSHVENVAADNGGCSPVPSSLELGAKEDGDSSESPLQSGG